MVMFTDKKSRAIEIEMSGDSVYAYHAGKEIGSISIEVVEYPHPIGGTPTIRHMDVDTNYQRAGIAMAMIEAASTELGTLSLESRVYDPTWENKLTDQGKGFIEICIKRRYVASLGSNE